MCGGSLFVKSCLILATPWTVVCQAPLSLGFSRQEYWSGLPFPSPMHACMISRFSRVRLCVTPWIAAHQAWTVFCDLKSHPISLEHKTALSSKLHIGEGNGNPLQYSCLENPRDRGAWQADVCGVTQSRTQLTWLSSSSSNSSKLHIEKYKSHRK